MSYVACTMDNNSKTAQATYATAGIDAVVFTPAMSDLFPKKGVLVTQLIDNFLAELAPGQKMILAPLMGFRTPKWLAEEIPEAVGEVMVSGGYHEAPRKVEFVASFHPEVVDAYLAMQTTIAAHLTSKGVVPLTVKNTLFAALDAELQFAPWLTGSVPNYDNAHVWADLGYTPSDAASEWDYVIGELASLYPNSIISQANWDPTRFAPPVDESGVVITEPGKWAKANATLQESLYAFLGDSLGARGQIVDTDLSAAPINAAYAAAKGNGCSVAFQLNTQLTAKQALSVLPQAIAAGMTALEIHVSQVKVFPDLAQAAKKLLTTTVSEGLPAA